MHFFAIRRFLPCLVIASQLALAHFASGQDETKQRSELGVRQKLVERRMTELENKLTAIADRLREKEPERAARLVQAYQQSREMLITRKMAEVSDLLDKNQLTDAEKKLNEVIQSLESLIRILVDQKEPPMTKEQEMQMLERWKEKISERVREQQQQRRETEKIADKEQTLDQLAAQIKKLEGLIDKQKQVMSATDTNQNAGIRALDQVADQQFEVREATEALSRELAGDSEISRSTDGQPVNKTDENAKSAEPKPDESNSKEPESGESKSDESKPDKQSERFGSDHPSQKSNGSQSGESKSGESKSGESKSGESKSGESKSGESKSGESKSGESKSGESKSGESGESKSGESKSGESKSGESKSGESKSGESKSGESKSGESKSGESPAKKQAPQPGQEALEQASEHQLKAEEKLSSGKVADSLRQQQDAIEEMEKALQELQKEKRRIESLPPEAMQQMADEQRRTRDKAMEIIDEMKKAPQSEENQNQNQDGNSSPSQPGQQSMEESGGSMQQAAEDLQNQNPEEAQQKQQQAEEKMEKALEEIEDRLNQLRDETREEKLARLEARFQEMLDRQVATSVMTVELDDRRTGLNGLRRRDQLLLLQLANEELEISEIGQQAYDLLLEDGTSVVFPEIVQELRQELQKAAQLLQNERTDQLLQLVQKEIEYIIQDLLDSLKEAKKDAQQESGGGGGGGGGENPLLKKSAELKILKLQQLRLNRRAKKIEQIRGAVDLDPLIQQETLEAAEFQQKLIQMLEGILEKEGE